MQVELPQDINQNRDRVIEVPTVGNPAESLPKVVLR